MCFLLTFENINPGVYRSDSLFMAPPAEGSSEAYMVFCCDVCQYVRTRLPYICNQSLTNVKVYIQT